MRRFHLRSSAFVVGSALCAWALGAASCSSSRGIRLSGAGGSGTGGSATGGIGSGGIGTGETIASGGTGGIVTGGIASGGSSASGGTGDTATGGIGSGGIGTGETIASGGTGGIVTGGAGSGGSSGSGGTSTPDGGSCPPGATAADCQLCGPDLSGTCQRACPKVDCSVYPVPAECAAVCAGATCCECQLSFGNEYFWRSPLGPPQCGTACSDIVSKWTGYMADSSLTACTIASDCIVVGGPSSSLGGCGSSMGGCGRGANAAAYRASPAATLESQFRSSCKQGFNACDCGGSFPECVGGTCTVGWRCSSCDAGTN
jgi:hypothetical protein